MYQNGYHTHNFHKPSFVYYINLGNQLQWRMVIFHGLDSSIYNRLYVWKHKDDMTIWNEASIHDSLVV
jgi:hypothetical protein